MTETAKDRRRYVYAVMVPEDTGLDRIYGTASKAIARLKKYGPTPVGAVGSLRSGKIVYQQPTPEHQYPDTHAVRIQVL